MLFLQNKDTNSRLTDTMNISNNSVDGTRSSENSPTHQVDIITGTLFCFCRYEVHGMLCENLCLRLLPGTIMILNFRTDRSGQTVQTQIRLLLEDQSDQGLHCLLFHSHVFVKIP